MQDWLSIDWFSWSKVSELTWSRPYVLYLLLGIPVLFAIRTFMQNRTRIRFPIATINGKLKPGWTHYFRLLSPILVVLTLTMMVIALARPQIANKTQNKISEGIDIVLAIDISESMLNTDINPNRLEASKIIAKEFILNRFQDRIGIVLFSGEAYTLSPLTTDYEALIDNIDEIKPKLIAAQGTAIGSAIGVSVNRLLEAKSKTKMVVLMSDGDNTAGNLDPVMAAQIANAHHVKLYTILVGGDSENAVIDSLTNNYLMSIDQQILETIAKTSDGKFYRASNLKNYKAIFNQINNLEKVKFLENSSQEMVDVFHVYLRWGIVFLLLTFFTKITFIGNILED